MLSEPNKYWKCMLLNKAAISYLTSKSCFAVISCITPNVPAVPLISTWQLLLTHCHSVTFRVATPFGGFGKAPRPAPTKSLLQEPLPNYPELQGDTAVDRPSFNRSALGWVSNGGPIPLTVVSLDPILVPESDDLWTTNEVTQSCCLRSCCTRGEGGRGTATARTVREKESFRLPWMQHPSVFQGC